MVAILRDPMSLFYTQKEEKEEGSGSPQSEMVVEGKFLETEEKKEKNPAFYG